MIYCAVVSHAPNVFFWKTDYINKTGVIVLAQFLQVSMREGSPLYTHARAITHASIPAPTPVPKTCDYIIIQLLSGIYQKNKT